MASYARQVAYDVELAARIRSLIGQDDAVTEQRMFGGLAFLVDGNMAVAAVEQGGLMVRIDPTDATRLLRSVHARPMEMRGRPMRGWLEVDSAGVRGDRQLSKWVDVGVAFARSLPAKRTSSTRD